MFHTLYVNTKTKSEEQNYMICKHTYTINSSAVFHVLKLLLPILEVIPLARKCSYWDLLKVRNNVILLRNLELNNQARNILNTSNYSKSWISWQAYLEEVARQETAFCSQPKIRSQDKPEIQGKQNVSIILIQGNTECNRKPKHLVLQPITV